MYMKSGILFILISEIISFAIYNLLFFPVNLICIMAINIISYLVTINMYFSLSSSMEGVHAAGRPVGPPGNRWTYGGGRCGMHNINDTMIDTMIDTMM